MAKKDKKKKKAKAEIEKIPEIEVPKASIALRSRVRLKDFPDFEGRVTTITHFLNGSWHFGVLGSVRNSLDRGQQHKAAHDWELEVLDTSESVELPAFNPELALGSHVEEAFTGFEGTITAHIYSAGGCVEMEVMGNVPLVGPKRICFDQEQLRRVTGVPAFLSEGDRNGSITPAVGRYD